ncbi:hypothetical protein CSUI_007001 [Cystoisospora suis]|uniref:Uncharacterized protein n=1 Tax=Cystoisospora suis TaxID=483139 RepID=A0A2C6KS35_9APIC|nr:hypothetical protein CSUI_007001 [Cystoisospora suis]
MTDPTRRLLEHQYDLKVSEKLQEMEMLKSQIRALDDEAALLQQELKSLLQSARTVVASAATLLPKRQRERILRGFSLNPSVLLASPPAMSEAHLLSSSSGEIGSLETQLLLLRSEYRTATLRAQTMRRNLRQREQNQSGSEDQGDHSSAGQVPVPRHEELDAVLQAQDGQLKALRSQILALSTQLTELKKASAARKTSQSSSVDDSSGEVAERGSGGWLLSPDAGSPSTSSEATWDPRRGSVSDVPSSGEGTEGLLPAGETSSAPLSTAVADLQASGVYDRSPTGEVGGGFRPAEVSGAPLSVTGLGPHVLAPGMRTLTPSGTGALHLASARDESRDETLEQRLQRLQQDLDLTRAYKHTTRQAYKHTASYWRDLDTYTRSVWRAREKKKAGRLQSQDGGDPSEMSEADMQLYKLMYEEKAPEKHKEIERLRDEIAKADRREQELEKEIQDLQAAQRKKRLIESQAGGPFAAEQHPSLFPTDGRPSVHPGESGSTAQGSSAMAAPCESIRAPSVATPKIPEVPVQTEVSRIENLIMLTKKKLANARCRIVTRRHAAEKLAASLPPEDSGTYESSRERLQRKEEGVRAAMQEAADHVRELEELETELVRLEAGAPGAGIFGRRRHRYAVRSEARRRAERATGDMAKPTPSASTGAPPPAPAALSASAYSFSTQGD